MPYWSDKIDCIKQWNARAPAEQLAMHYQPIDTAPKDGTEVIGIYLRPADEWSSAFVYGPWTMAWDHRKSRWCSSWDGWEVVKYMSDFGTEYKELDMQPTHWSPFPTFAKPEEPPT